MQNSEAKNEILASIRRNLAKSAPFDVVHREHHAHQEKLISVPQALICSDDLQNTPLIEHFRENLISIGGKCEIVTNLGEAFEIINAIIAHKRLKRIAVSDANLVREIRNWFDADLEILENVTAQELFESDLGITGAQFAIAETGTLVIESDKEFNRLTSLIPPIHICLMESEKIKQTLGEILEILEKDLSRTVTFITGPSRTSDIELTPVIGVHGPAELYVIIVDKSVFATYNRR